MEIPGTVLRRLVCDTCAAHLSRGPVYLLDNGRSRCGRCTGAGLSDDARRMLPYEELARLMVFPCRYSENGCQQQVLFSENQQHEDTCAFKPFACPIGKSGKCAWFRGRSYLLDHCKQAHPRTVVENPVQLRYNNINKSSVYNYLLPAFQHLFLVQSKVCADSRQLYHCVRLIGDPSHAGKYQFTIDIVNDQGTRLSKPGRVTVQGCMTLQEDTAVATGLRSLHEQLGALKAIIFTITIHATQSRAKNKSTATATSTTLPITNCMKIQPVNQQNNSNNIGLQHQLVSAPVNQDQDKNSNSSSRRACINKTQGCRYTDIDDKCRKHELYYCQYSVLCPVCLKHTAPVSLVEHYRQTHADIMCRTGSKFSMNSKSCQQRWCIITSDFGQALCQYMVIMGCIDVTVYTPLPSDQLYRYDCVLCVCHPKRTRKFPLQVKHRTQCDWKQFIEHTELENYATDTEYHIKIDFIIKSKS